MLYDQLKQDGEDFIIWWDDKLKISEDWVFEIERHLDELVNYKPDSCLLYMITPYSSDVDRDNFCIKEVVRALGGKVRIFPVKLADAPMPLLLGNIQWLDFTDCKIDKNNKEYIRRVGELLKCIKEGKEPPHDGKQGALANKLEPISFSLDIDKHYKDYVPRDALLASVKYWIEESNEHLLLLLGGPGTGKTAFSIWMSYSELSNYIAAWHLCQYNIQRTCNLYNVVKSLAYYLALRIPEFYKALDVALVDKILNEADTDAGSLFKYLILEPLCRIKKREEPLVILIDALDEASRGNDNDLAGIIAYYVEQLPDWLKIIVTSRNDISVTTHLEDCSYIIDMDSPDSNQYCMDDVRNYIRHLLGDGHEKLNLVAENSKNNFLYAQVLCDSIRKKTEISDSDIPKAINSYYNSHLKRYFKNSKYNFDDHARPLLNIILTSYEPIEKSFLSRRLSQTCTWCKRYGDFNNVVNCFGPLLKESEDCLIPFHKSLADWFISEKNREYQVFRVDGLNEMINWGLEIVNSEYIDKEDKLVKHFFYYLPQYMIEANDSNLPHCYANIKFWKRRNIVLGVNEMLKLLIEELKTCKLQIRNRIFEDEKFFNVLDVFNVDLFNTGRYGSLRQLGYMIPIVNGMSDQKRLFAIRYYYINGLYSEIVSNINVFKEPYSDQIVRAMVMNELGQTYRKLGEFSSSADAYKESLDLAINNNSTQDEIIYTMLNLSRIYTSQCDMNGASKQLEEAFALFEKGLWRNSIQGVDADFSSQQLERAVYYVALETQLFSLSIDDNICTKSLQWADDVYADPLRRDRYYSNHLISKFFYKVRKHDLGNIEELIKEYKQTVSDKYDDLRFSCVESLMNLGNGNTDKALDIVISKLEYIKTLDKHKIQLAEYMAIYDIIKGMDQSTILDEELIPWYHHFKLIVEQIMQGN